MRDTRSDEAYFAVYIEKAAARMLRNSAKLDSYLNDPVRGTYYPQDFSLFEFTAFSLFQASYSAGESIEHLRPRLDQATDAFLLAKKSDVQYMQEDKVAIRHNFRTRRDIYISALWILSLNILFDSSEDRIKEVITASGNDGVDGVFDLIASRYVTDRPVADEAVYAAPYRRLLEVFHAPEEDRAKLVNSFLKVWYQQNKKTDWWGEAERIQLGSVLYSGYWCFEAAAVVKLLGIDDSLFRDNEYYPADLVHINQELV